MCGSFFVWGRSARTSPLGILAQDAPLYRWRLYFFSGFCRSSSPLSIGAPPRLAILAR